MQEWNLFRVTGQPDDIGYRLGELARPIMAAYMQQSAAWQRVSRWRGHPFVETLRRAAEAHFPALMAELEGMAAGLGWPMEDVFLWNCRGELIHNAPDGCTTLAAVSGNARFIAHNEDGDPYLRERCFLVDVQPAGKPGFVSFYYPGSLPGHTFAANRAGLVQTINNLRIRSPAAGVPRMILARAVLDTRSLDEAVSLLSDAPRASGFHHTLGCVGDARLLSIEASVQRCSVVVDASRFGHANHMIHAGCENEAQIVTESSRDRQSRVDALLPTLRSPLGDDTLLRVLRDQATTGLPIFRDDPHDPDDENTLATALFRLEADGVAMQVYRREHCAFDTFIPRTAH
ncbi:C45 family autoproteolytic acyltransferase/hydolase [Paraburkholderia sp. BCC1885]|uniref:C45 family autoproteolytic acyltransferase/hydolase n=1 Tax=Paraburkholderia sp. BCC1885 TaxID=2562669 RepID=UPI001181F60B|nr:C45 family peptidase [Paraburkholderia sp. BCC1885]